MQQKVFENLGAELQRINGYPLVDAVEQRREVQVGRQLQRREPEAADPQRAKGFASVPPDSMYGTVRASGSAASSASFIASSSSPSKVVS